MKNAIDQIDGINYRPARKAVTSTETRLAPCASKCVRCGEGICEGAKIASIAGTTKGEILWVHDCCV